MGFAQPAGHPTAGELLPHHFTLTRILPWKDRWRYVSVALSVGSPPLGVTQHPARWSSDFPLARKRAVTRSACPKYTLVQAPGLVNRGWAGGTEGIDHPPFPPSCPGRGEGRMESSIEGHPQTPATGAPPLWKPRPSTGGGGQSSLRSQLLASSSQHCHETARRWSPRTSSRMARERGLRPSRLAARREQGTQVVPKRHRRPKT